MLKNYLKIAWRNLVKGKLYSIINIVGLAVGVACCIMVGLYVYEELRYDTFHEKADRIYRVNMISPQGRVFAKTPQPLINHLDNEYPEVKNVVPVDKERGVVRVDQQLFEERFLVTTPSFFEVFDFSVIEGNPAKDLANPKTVYLSKSAARQYYGNIQVVGKPIALRISGAYYRATVAGIVEDPVDHSSLQFKVILPKALWRKAAPASEVKNNWNTTTGTIFVELNKKTQPDSLGSKITYFVRKNPDANSMGQVGFELQNIQDVHIGDRTIKLGNNVMSPSVNPNFIYIAILVGLLVLTIACINYTILSIGYSARRAREIGMRKVVGAHRRQIVYQFLGEMVIIAVFSLFVALLLVELLLPFFNQVMGSTLTFNLLQNPGYLLVITGVVVLAGLIAGSYPALYLSRFQPTEVFRSTMTIEGRYTLSRILTTVQFALAALLIIGSLVMQRQMNMLQERSLGFNEEEVIQVEVPFGEGYEILEKMRTMTQNSVIKNISGTFEMVGGGSISYNDSDIKSGDEKVLGKHMGVTPNLIKTLEIELHKGRHPRLNNDNSNTEVLVNRKLVEEFGWEDPIGKKTSISYLAALNNATVVGVVNNFHYESLHSRIFPLLMYPSTSLVQLYAKFEKGKERQAIKELRNAWSNAAPGIPFKYTFLEDHIDRQYQKERRWMQLIELASAITIFLAVMRLFGMATMVMSKRSKEVSIRKVLGASTGSILKLLSTDFLKPVLIGFFLAVPLGYLFIQNWLQNFAYRIDMGVGVFAMAGLILVAIALIAISWQSIRVATANPVNHIRGE